jgi:TonB family protein
MRALLFTKILIFLSFISIGAQAQYNGCLQKSELLQLQTLDLSNASVLMRTKSWKFDGIKEASSPSESRFSAINQAVVWKSPDGNESIYYFDNEENANFIIVKLHEECYHTMISGFSEKENGSTSVYEGKLITTFVSNEVCIEFLEGAKKNFEIRLYASFDKEKFYELISVQTGPNGESGGSNWSLSGRTILNNPKVQGNAPDEGTVTVDIWVDANGNVTKAMANAAKSNTSNGTLFRMAEDAARKAKFSSSPTGNEQKGSIKITFKLN